MSEHRFRPTKHGEHPKAISATSRCRHREQGAKRRCGKRPTDGVHTNADELRRLFAALGAFA
jgi:hypothetical protein